MKEERNEGITLIALIVTIIIMLILAGIVIVQLTGENGLIAKAQLVKERTEYQTAKEEVNIKLSEVIIECEAKGIDYSIEEIYEAIEKDDEKTIEKIFNKETGAVKSGVKDTIIDLSDIVVSVKKYSKYKFLVGEEGQIDGVTTGEITDLTTKADFISIAEFENSLAETNVNPEVTAKSTNTENLKRKTNLPFSNLFNIKTNKSGTIKYEVTGNMKYNNKAVSETKLTNVSELELGAYTVKCTITDKNANGETITLEDEKVVTITELAETTFTNVKGETKTGKALYSVYDVAEFRDLVNQGGDNLSLNAQLQEDIDLSKVCGEGNN